MVERLYEGGLRVPRKTGYEKDCQDFFMNNFEKDVDKRADTMV